MGLTDSGVVEGGAFSLSSSSSNTMVFSTDPSNMCFLDKLNCVAKLNVALGFILKNIDDGKYRYFYAHENNTLLEQSKLVRNKDNMAKLKEILKKTDVIESCTKEGSNTKWRFFKLTNLTRFDAILKDIPMGCKDAVLSESLLRNPTVNCLTYEQNTKKKHTKTIFASSEHLLSTCVEMRDSRKKQLNYSISFLLTVQILTKFSRSLHG